MKAAEKPVLDRPAVYQVRVPGELDSSWSNWDGGTDFGRKRGGWRVPAGYYPERHLQAGLLARPTQRHESSGSTASLG
jgi:hypothetical protein